jgi:hypothetical protein
MPHPWMHLALTRPDLLVDHGASWVHLLGDELPLAWHANRRRLLWWVLAVLLAQLGLGLAGVAALLSALLAAWGPQAQAAGPAFTAWLPAGLGVPAVPLLLAVLCAWQARRQHDGGAWLRLREQWAADAGLRGPGQEP